MNKDETCSRCDKSVSCYDILVDDEDGAHVCQECVDAGGCEQRDVDYSHLSTYVFGHKSEG